jgi:hypothetical protein
MTDDLGRHPAGARAAVTAGAAEAWLESLAHLYAVPAPHRVEDAHWDQALEILRCGPAVLDELVSAGLPHAVRPAGMFFDRHDLINLALHSGSGRSMPERAVRYALRWMREDPCTWTIPLEWTFDIQMSCGRSGGCGEDPRFTHTRLLPEASGGAIRYWECDAPVRMDDEELALTGPGPVRFAGRLRTEGSLMRLRSPRLRQITEDFLAAGYRWARLPKVVQADVHTVMAHGVAPCVTASLFLEQEYRAAGYQAISRSGWILGMLDLAHAWVEVVDSDGFTKCVDVVFDRLSRLAEGAHPDLARAALGSRVNRILPTAATAGAPHARHRCAGQLTAPQTRTVIRRLGIQ